MPRSAILLSALALSVPLVGCSLTPPPATPLGNPVTINQSGTMPNPNQSAAPEVKAQGATLHTTLGDLTVAFYPESPNTVANFTKLAKAHFYDGVKFHRVIKGFMAQTGDPNSKDDDWSNDGTGGPGYMFPDEFNQHKLTRGSLAMANSGPDTNGSQFFIVTAPATPWLDGHHTNFGYVTAGLDVLAKIEAAKTNAQDHPLEDIVIKSISVSS